MVNRKKVIVFGGSGFLGSHVADALSNEGYNVTIFDIKPSPYLHASQKMIVGNVLDREQVDEAVRGNNIVYNYAAVADIKEAHADPVKTVNINLLSTVYMLEACVKYKIDKFIFGSTVYVYSDHGSFYRCSKQSAELFIENYYKAHNLNYSILRYGSLYGKRANSFNFINNIIHEALLYKKISRMGNGEEIREYINVIDAARASVLVLDKKYDNSHIIVTGNQSIKVKDLFNMVKEIFNNNIDVEYSDDRLEEHYNITPYSFKPNLAKKIQMDYYQDLGQGILEAIYDSYKNLSAKNKELLKIDMP